MLEELHVRDLALIEDVRLAFGPGMTVLTGETGAGKTALVGALKLLLGERADSQSVRSGASEALVEGRFYEADEELIVSRRVGADGRSRCSIDGEMATVGSLGERIGPRVDLHGQHEHQALLSISTHATYLDRWGGDALQSLLETYRRRLVEYREAGGERDRLHETLSRAAQEVDYLRFVVADIDAVDPQPGEDAELEARLPSLQHAERLSLAASQAVDALKGEGGVLDGIAKASAALGRVAGVDARLDEIAGRIAEAGAIVDDVAGSTREYRDAIEDDPVALEATHDRLARLSGLMKKYGPRLEDVLAKYEEARATLESAETGDEALKQADAAVQRARDDLRSAGAALAGRRAEIAPGFSAALKEAVADLAMSGASFEVSAVDLDLGEWTAAGPQRIEFLYSPGAGQAARPLSKIASGGELSRVMLALKGVLGSADTVRTLVFDEIDAGIGGATAIAIGRRLRSLAKDHQVIVVTHLAQVAAFADAQLVVRKESQGGLLATSVARVEGDERVTEIARMLSGNDSEASVAHARELLEQTEGTAA